MERRLRMIDESTDVTQLLGENLKKVEMLKQALQNEHDPDARLTLFRNLASQLVFANKNEEAIRAYSEIEDLEKRGGIPVNDRERSMALAVAYLRLGEQENCLLGHTSESCLLPIQGGGIHKARRGSENAIKHFTRVLQLEPDNYTARWLLNIANMTLGQYPAGVPAKLLIAPDVFKSEFEIKRFHEIAGGLGLDLNRISGGTIIEDFDNDGLLDIITSSIHSREPLRCFHNDGNGTFTDVTQKAGLEGETGGLNIMQTDYDNDGWADVLVLRGAWYEKNGHWPLSLLHNNGNGTFTDVTEKAGLLRFHPTQTAVWFDYNGDGKLDLFVGNESRGADVNPSELFHNNGDGTFTEVARDCGLAFTEFVKGAVSADYNNDGRPDLFLSVMGGPNRLLRNDGPGPGGKTWKFTDVSKEAGVDNPGMSFSCFFFDYDNDGWEDLFVTSYDYRNLDVGEQAKDYLGMNVDRDYPCLYHNNRNGTFTNVWPRSRGRLLWGMGINFGDLDGDGWLDFYVGTGNPALEFLSPNRMFRNNGGKSFQDVTTSGGFGHLQKGHAISFGDLNNDGAQDIYESMGGLYEGDTAYNALYENPGFGSHWLYLKLEGVQSNRAAIGARIKLVISEAGKQREIHRTVGTGGSFGANPFRQEIGLGKASFIERVEIMWPVTGKTQTVLSLQLDCSYKIREDSPNAVILPTRPFKFAHNAAGHHHRAD